MYFFEKEIRVSATGINSSNSLITDIKKVMRLLLEFSICYFSACVFSVVKIDNIKMVCLVVFAVSLCAVLVEVIYIIIGKIITFIKQKVAKTKKSIWKTEKQDFMYFL